MRSIYNLQKIKTDANGRLEIAGNTDVDTDGRWYVRADSRPKEWDIYFTGAGDDLVNGLVGEGKDFTWDFSNIDDLDPTPPTGFKRKIVQFQFLDPIKAKEGTIYFYDAPKFSYIDFYIVCPPGYPYPKKTVDAEGNLQVEIVYATENTKCMRWVSHYHMVGSAPMGDELNTEAADESQTPPYMIWQVEITTPDTDNSSYGHFTLELYRGRTISYS